MDEVNGWVMLVVVVFVLRVIVRDVVRGRHVRIFNIIESGLNEVVSRLDSRRTSPEQAGSAKQ